MTETKTDQGAAKISQAQPTALEIATASFGAAVAIAVLMLIQSTGSMLFVLGSLGATSFLVFAFPNGPFSRPRNVIGGHFLSSFVGLLVLSTLGTSFWSVGLAVGLAIAAMMLSDTVHPPAASNPLLIFLLSPSWWFLLAPTLSGAVTVVVVAYLYNQIVKRFLQSAGS